MTPTEPMELAEQNRQSLLENPVWFPESRLMTGVRMEMNARLVAKMNLQQSAVLDHLEIPDHMLVNGDRVQTVIQCLTELGNRDLDQAFARRDQINKWMGMGGLRVRPQRV